MASAFEEEKHTGERSNLFDDLDKKHGFAPATPTAPGGFGSALGGAFRTVDDAVRAAADTITFGLLDRGLNASGLEPKAIERTLEARERSPVATIAGDIGGGVATMAATPLRAVGAGTAAALGGARVGLPGIAGRAAGYGLEGAGFGAAQSAGHTYDLGSLPGNVATGATIGGIGGAVTGPFTPRSALMARPRAEVPSNPELGSIAGGGYATARSNPYDVAYSNPALRAEAERIQQELFAKNFHAGTAGKTFRGLDMPAQADAAATRAGSGISASHTPSEVEAIRQALNTAKKPSDIAAAQIAKENLDRFTANPSFSTLSRGTPAGARATDEILQTARGNQAAKFRSDIIRDTEENVARSTATRNSGLNYENNMRSAIAKVLASEGKSFSAAERAGLENLAKRTDAWNQVRTVGNLLGGGGGLGAIVTGGAGAGAAGYATGDPWAAAGAGLLSAGVGRGARALSNRSMKSAVNQMDEIIRSRSPEFERRFAADPTTLAGKGTSAATLAARNAIIEAMIRREQEDPKRPKITVYARPGEGVR